MPDLGLEFLAQVHDSVLLQYPETNEAEVLDTALQVMKVPINVTSYQGRKLRASIPLEAAVGWNWAGHSPHNPDGLVKIKPGATDGRTRSHIPTP